MKNILLILISFLLLCSCTERERFKIKISFCDGRPPIITTTDVRADRPPSNYDICNLSYRTGGGYRSSGRIVDYAVPEYETYEYTPSGSPIKADNFKTTKYLNVCNIEIIK